MNVLVACEESQRVCIAFRERGFNAFSCDLQDCSGGHPEWHIKGDCLVLLKESDINFITCDNIHHAINSWDLVIAHPPCIYLTRASAVRLYPHKGQLDYDRYIKGCQAKIFFLNILKTKVKHLCVENPQPLTIYNLPKWAQIVQPYEYGHNVTKKTCLWLRGLPKLKPTNVVKPFGCYCELTSNSKERSKTFKGIAEAMAQQWGNYIMEMR